MSDDIAPAAPTPSQTVGPFLHIALAWPDGTDVVPEGTPDAVTISGRVVDGDGEPVTDALVETWQADADGRFAHPGDPRTGNGPIIGSAGFRGFGRCPTDQDGRWSIRTVVPGALPTPDGRTEAPHLDVSVFARGLLDRVVTRIYFADQPANDADPVLAAVPPGRRHTLVAAREGDSRFRFDITLQGPDETVFFDL